MLKREPQTDPSIVDVHLMEMPPEEGEGGPASPACMAAADLDDHHTVERPSKKPKVLGQEKARDDVTGAGAPGDACAETPVAVAHAQAEPEPRLSFSVHVGGAAVAAETGAETECTTVAAAHSQVSSTEQTTIGGSSAVRVEFLTGSASSRREFWKLAETLQADVLRNNRRWRRRAQLAAAAAAPGAEPLG